MTTRDKKIEELEKEINELKKRYSGSGTSQSNGMTLTYAELLKPGGGKKSEHEVVLTTKLVKEQQELKKREGNIIVMGLPESNSNDKEEIKQHDEKLVKDLARELNVNYEWSVKSLRRLGKKRTLSTNAVSENVVSESSSVTNTNRSLSILLIECKEGWAFNYLQAAKQLKNSNAFSNVYINKDRTESEWQVHAAMMKERNKRNNEFTNKDDNGRGYKIRKARNTFGASEMVDFV